MLKNINNEIDQIFIHLISKIIIKSAAYYNSADQVCFLMNTSDPDTEHEQTE